MSLEEFIGLGGAGECPGSIGPRVKLILNGTAAMANTALYLIQTTHSVLSEESCIIQRLCVTFPVCVIDFNPSPSPCLTSEMNE